MKARVQKLMQRYLQGEREGFSLVELIIVIAIMAILIAVVALAVIPYINSARNAKVHDAVNNVQSAFKTIVAKEKYAKVAKTDFKDPVKLTDTCTTKSGLKLGEDIQKITDKKPSDIIKEFGSTNADGGELYVQVTTSGECIVFVSKDGSTVLEDDDKEKFQAGGTKSAS